MNHPGDRLVPDFVLPAKRIQVSPGAKAALHVSIQHRRTPRPWRLPALVAASVVIIAAVAIAFLSPKSSSPTGTSQPADHSAAMPALDASPADVLDAYLAALKARACAVAAALATDTFTVGNGELCGVVTIDSYTDAIRPAATGTQMTYAITLQVASGSTDGTVPAGAVPWFYTLQRQHTAASAQRVVAAHRRRQRPLTGRSRPAAVTSFGTKHFPLR